MSRIIFILSKNIITLSLISSISRKVQPKGGKEYKFKNKLILRRKGFKPKVILCIRISLIINSYP